MRKHRLTERDNAYTPSSDVFSALSSDIPFGVVPEENSIFGGVVETFDLFRTPASAFVRGEVTLKVEHCLLVKNGTELHEITRIMSHEQVCPSCILRYRVIVFWQLSRLWGNVVNLLNPISLVSKFWKQSQQQQQHKHCWTHHPTVQLYVRAFAYHSSPV